MPDLEIKDLHVEVEGKPILKGIDLEGIVHADFSPDDRFLAVGYSNGKAAWWDISTRKPRALFECQYFGAVQVAFSPDERLFATGGVEGPPPLNFIVAL